MHHFHLYMAIPIDLLPQGVIPLFLQSMHDPSESNARVLQCCGKCSCEKGGRIHHCGLSNNIDIYKSTTIPTYHIPLSREQLTSIHMVLTDSHTCFHGHNGTPCLCFHSYLIVYLYHDVICLRCPWSGHTAVFIF